MRIQLAQGEQVEIYMLDREGTITVSYSVVAVAIHCTEADFMDRKGLVYEDRYNDLRPGEKEETAASPANQ